MLKTLMLALLLIFAKLITVFRLGMNYVMKTKSVGETINNEAKEQNRGFLEMLLGTLGATVL